MLCSALEKVRNVGQSSFESDIGDIESPAPSIPDTHAPDHRIAVAQRIRYGNSRFWPPHVMEFATHCHCMLLALRMARELARKLAVEAQLLAKSESSDNICEDDSKVQFYINSSCR